MYLQKLLLIANYSASGFDKPIWGQMRLQSDLGHTYTITMYGRGVSLYHI